MGDLITQAVEGSLYYADRKFFQAIRDSNFPIEERLSMFSDAARLNALYMIARAGSGHIGSSFSSIDIMCFLYLEMMDEGDIFFSSKGHDSPALYAVLTAIGNLQFDLIHKLRKAEGLPGHPDIKTPSIATNTGSLGMGISKAKGMIHANRLLGKSSKVFVLTGDGELQEGQIWESLVSAVNHNMSELIVLVDHNKIQSDYSAFKTSDLGDLESKFQAFGWNVTRINGHSFHEIGEALVEEISGDVPRVIIADTIKGKGVSFMEGTSIDSDVERFEFHSGAPTAKIYAKAVNEIKTRLATSSLSQLVEEVGLKEVVVEGSGEVEQTKRLIPAYGKALESAMDQNPKLVVLDADLSVDMGLEVIRSKYPKRFFECGIAEMDMVSQAGGLALSGLTPVVNSFACFLTTRANEQIYNNSTERKRILYVGGLAGVLPGGPGHSHQSVRDVSLMGSIPGMLVLDPSHPDELAAVLDWCLSQHDGPSYLRMVSIPIAFMHAPPRNWHLFTGQGYHIEGEGDHVILCNGALAAKESIMAARALGSRDISSKVYTSVFSNYVDADWLSSILANSKSITTVENHYDRFGFGDSVLSALAKIHNLSIPLLKIGLSNYPISGDNDETLREAGIDSMTIVEKVEKFIRG
ncbi:hypothetical protein N9417_02930 [Pseudomonadales bacterium]|nr:hypothetical protein [Pseudomonadales bacterium]